MNDESTFDIAPNSTPVYEPPSMFSNVGLSLEKITVGRNSGTQDFVWDDFDLAVYITNKIIGITVVVVSITLIWLITLLVLKFMGRDRVGCAAGFAFHDEDSEDLEESLAEDPEEQKDSEASDSSFREDNEETSMDGKKIDSESVEEETNEADDLETTIDGEKSDNESVDEKTNQADDSETSIDGKKIDSEFVDEDTSQAEDRGSKCCEKICCCAFDSKHVSYRKFQTRLVFTLFANALVLCCMLMLVYWYAPLKSAASTSKSVVEVTDQISDEITIAFGKVVQSSRKLDEWMLQDPMSYSQACPGIPQDNFLSLVGINMRQIYNDYGYEVPKIIALLDTAAVGKKAIKVLADANATIINIIDFAWVINCVISFTILITFSQLGSIAYAVYKEATPKDTKTNASKLENCFGWTVLPLQFLMLFASLTFIIVFYSGVTIATDFCMPAMNTNMNDNTENTGTLSPTQNAGGGGDGTSLTSGRGTPEDTIMALSSFDSEVNDLFMSYLTGCQNDPLADLFRAQDMLKTNLGNIDLSGLEDLEGLSAVCGPDNRLEDFINFVTVIHDQYIMMLDGFDLSYSALSCPRVNAAYIYTTQKSVCTDFATSTANGFLLTTIMSFCGMILISLRAAWRTSV